MKMNEVKKRARQLGINPGKLSKTEIIRTMQKKEGNFDCFGTAADYCDQTGCAWREDCLTHQK